MYEDGLRFLYFNTTGTKGGNNSIKKLLNYIQDSKINNVTDKATKEIHDCVSRVKVLPEARMGYMLLEEKFFYRELEGEIKGELKGVAGSVIELLEEVGTLPEELLVTIKKENDLDTLKKWLKAASKADSIEEFIENM